MSASLRDLLLGGGRGGIPEAAMGGDAMTEADGVPMSVVQRILLTSHHNTVGGFGVAPPAANVASDRGYNDPYLHDDHLSGVSDQTANANATEPLMKAEAAATANNLTQRSTTGAVGKPGLMEKLRLYTEDQAAKQAGQRQQ